MVAQVIHRNSNWSQPWSLGTLIYFNSNRVWDLPGGTVVKNPPTSAGNTGSIPGPERSHVPQGS